MPQLWCFTTTLIEHLLELARSSPVHPKISLDCKTSISPPIVVVLYDNFYWTLARTCVWWQIRTSAWYVFLASEWSLFTPQHYNNSSFTLNLKITILSVFTPQHYTNSVCPRPGLVADLWSRWSLIFLAPQLNHCTIICYNLQTSHRTNWPNGKS